jgi:hypothetical protein
MTILFTSLFHFTPYQMFPFSHPPTFQAQDLQNCLIKGVPEELCSWRKLVTTLFVGRAVEWIVRHPPLAFMVFSCVLWAFLYTMHIIFTPHREFLPWITRCLPVVHYYESRLTAAGIEEYRTATLQDGALSHRQG